MSTVSLNFYSAALNFRTEVQVALPEYPRQRDASCPCGEAFDPNVKFPVVYLLHGFTGDYTDWTTMMPLERYAGKYGFAVVMPHGMNTWYLNVPHGPNMQDFIAKELPAAMEALLPVSADPKQRFIAGLSMGGGGTLRTAYRYPEKYRAAAAMSALVDPLPLVEYDGALNEADARIRDSLLYCFGGREGMASEENSVMKLALKQKKAGIPLPPVLFQMGKQDTLYPTQYPAFRRFAEENGLPVTFAEKDGAHDFDYWEPTIQESLAWFRAILDKDK